MATAKIETKHVEKIVKTVVVEKEDSIVLTLTREEARTLRTVQGRISGTPSGRRGHFDSIGHALSAVGIHGDQNFIQEAPDGYYAGIESTLVLK